MVYAVYVTKSFEKEILVLSDKDSMKIRKIFQKLRDNPYIGDTIRYEFFREKRIKEKRLYYLVYDDLKVVLIVAFGSKKAQQGTINKIAKYFPEYREYTEKLFR